MLVVQGSLGASAHSLLNLDCALGSDPAIRPVYVNTLTLALVPFLNPLLAYIVRLIILKIEMQRQEEERNAIDSKNDGSLENKTAEVVRRLDSTDMRIASTVHSSMPTTGLAKTKTDVNDATSQSAHDANRIAKAQSYRMSRASTGSAELEEEIFLRASDEHKKEISKRTESAIYHALILSLFYVFYPAIVLASLELFRCEPIGSSNESRLDQDMEVRCFEGTHTTIALAVGIPMLVIYTLGFPAYNLFLLVTKRSSIASYFATSQTTLQSQTIYLGRIDSMVCHFVFNGFKLNYYPFELLSLFRKVAIPTIAVFVQDNLAQSLIISLIIGISLVIHVSLSPYESDKCNLLDAASLLTSLLTYSLGSLLYYEEGGDRVAASVFIMIANVLFFAGAFILLVMAVLKERADSDARERMRREKIKMNSLKVYPRRPRVHTNGALPMPGDSLLDIHKEGKTPDKKRFQKSTNFQENTKFETEDKKNTESINTFGERKSSIRVVNAISRSNTMSEAPKIRVVDIKNTDEGL
eukprot:CAMPEP_0167745568 /NCGR_PEP_ID=MMETSP0110_2-20121227/3222_1 /TAXON_ID=629695 /ORGANISM="Gymnochlora sp., Strain CCMP2014" /LENGTH=525 /DNA_ID=CAMNT_0007630221 /DNA_START=632 /DNA_END=2209 /DNA_ORIENTATION=-